jgi:hypothetical protein
MPVIRRGLGPPPRADNSTASVATNVRSAYVLAGGFLTDEDPWVVIREWDVLGDLDR